MLRKLFFLSWGCKVWAFYFFCCCGWYGWLIHGVSQYGPKICENKIRQICLTTVIEELPWKLLPYHWHKNSIHILIKRERDVLLTLVIALNICKPVSCWRSEIIWAAMGCLHNKTSSQWVKIKHMPVLTPAAAPHFVQVSEGLHMQERNGMKNLFYNWDMHQIKEGKQMKGSVSALSFSLLSPDLDHPHGRTNMRSKDWWSLFSFSLCHLDVSPLLACLSILFWASYSTHYSISTFIMRTESLSIIIVIVKVEILVPEVCWWRL